MDLPIFVVDAFCRGSFSGNPAAVVPLQEWLPDSVLGAIARQNNLSETAFIVGSGSVWSLRWFTPVLEVALCGHATLGAAHIVFDDLVPGIRSVAFSTRQAGELVVERSGHGYEMTFPAVQVASADSQWSLTPALGRAPVQVMVGCYSDSECDALALFDSQADVLALDPDMSALSRLDCRGVICTAAGADVDFVSRYFAPRAGVPEDPVTGSAHCLLTPFWARRLGRTTLWARQLSSREGWLRCTDDGPRVRLWGEARTYLRGRISI